MVAKLVSLAVVVSAVSAFGCTPGVPRLDCTSADTMRASLEEMKKSLSEDEKKQLNVALVKEAQSGITAMAKEFSSAAKVGQQPPSIDEFRAKFDATSVVKHLHGKSAKEILALANGPNSSPPPPPPPPAQ